MPPTPLPPTLRLSLSPQGRRAVMAVLAVSALVGVALGIETTVLHLRLDPLADVRIYYEAGARLNAGAPLYGVGSDTGVGWYVYPPLLAMAFRPLALLPFPVAAVIWEGVIIAATALAVRRAGLTRWTALALAWLAQPVGWALAVGQAEPVVTALLAFGTPASVALAGHVKLVPWLAAAYWLGRGDGKALARFTVWVLTLGLLQLLLEPAATVSMLRGEWLAPAFGTRNISPFALSPLLWAVLAAAGLGLALRLARGRWGWSAAVLLAVLANPRLLVYQLMSLLAAMSDPRGQDPVERGEPA